MRMIVIGFLISVIYFSCSTDDSDDSNSNNSSNNSSNVKTSQNQCLENTPSEQNCKDCCDCAEELSCDEKVACRDTCVASGNFSNKGDLTPYDPKSILGPDGDYSKCFAEADEKSCKNCCECTGGFSCGDFRYCRDECKSFFGQ